MQAAPTLKQKHARTVSTRQEYRRPERTSAFASQVPASHQGPQHAVRGRHTQGELPATKPPSGDGVSLPSKETKYVCQLSLRSIAGGRLCVSLLSAEASLSSALLLHDDEINSPNHALK